MADLSFRVEATDGVARAGVLETPHGPLDTPAFFPVATYGAVRGVAPWELEGAGVQGVLCNTYHLHLRPGAERVQRLGGLHGFIQWNGPILTDSGGFQVHSMDHLARAEESGVHFRSPIDGARHHLTPERCIAVQEALGADLIVTLDHFQPARTGTREAEGAARACLERTLRWAERCRGAWTRPDQWLFGIVQGGGFPELRSESAERTRTLDFPAYAVGGLGLGEDRDARLRLLESSLEPLPRDTPRYLMGIGQPDDLVEAVARGVDLFDCVLPTRNARHGSAYTSQGVLGLRNARFADDTGPLDPTCRCACCARLSRGYLHHLFKIGESLSGSMLSVHNIAYYMRLMRALRRAVQGGGLGSWMEHWRSGQRDPDACGVGTAPSAAHSPA